MSTPAPADHAQLEWVEIWRLFDSNEQCDACRCLIEVIRDEWDDDTARRLIHRLARGTNSRIASVETLIRERPEKAVAQIKSRATALFDNSIWKRLFEAYYSRRKTALMIAFLDALEVEHDEFGFAADELPLFPAEKVAAAIDVLLRTFSTREVARYLAVIVRHDPAWASAGVERDRLLSEIKRANISSDAPAFAQAALVAATSTEFDVLDRVLIEQVVRTVMQIDGSLDAGQIVELVESVARLNESWHRAEFHLGFVDVLLPGRERKFERPGDNVARRGWYLAGAIAGAVRGNDQDLMERILAERRADLLHALSEPGGPGASLTETAFRWMVDGDHLPEALAAIRGQVRFLGLRFANMALGIATTFIRQSRFEHAKVIVDALGKGEFENEDARELQAFRLALARRRGQCLQAAGDFDGAEREYRELLKAGEDKNSPDLLADLGLVKGRFRSIEEVRLTGAAADRVAIREGLTKGDHHFQRAAEQFGVAAPKAAFALALLAYLKWASSGDKDKEHRRELAVVAASNAVSAILSSQYSAVYRALGALGQVYFMLAVLRMNGFDVVQGREALAAWKSITDEAGRLPEEDLKQLLDAAELYGPEFADPIAESVWEFRHEDALSVLKDGQWMARSTRLRSALRTFALNTATPVSERLRAWMLLVPAQIKEGDLGAAEDGLGEIERLPESAADLQLALTFLATQGNYDPAWKESEAGLARVYMLRRLGRDPECAEEIRRLFYLVRDANRWEAEQLITALEEWNIGSDVREDLRRALPKSDADVPKSVAERLESGEKVAVLFVGGNEVQAQYDEAIRTQLSVEWSGVSIRFEHTGWSSNWGRDLARLVDIANGVDVVVLMPMMRTTLGRRLREALKKPWVSCASTGKGGMLLSIRRAALVAVRLRTERTTASVALG